MTDLTDLYLTTMANGEIWAVPVMVIARDRAKNYKDEFGDSVERSLAEDTLPLFAECPAEIFDWAQNNMNWSDVVSEAWLYGAEPQKQADCEESWTNGHHDIVKRP